MSPTKKTTKKAAKGASAEPKTAKKKKTAKATEEVTPDGIRIYDSRQSFKKGEKIYHKFWEETGKIMETGTTEDGVKKMLVQFETVGEKKLIMDHKLKS